MALRLRDSKSSEFRRTNNKLVDSRIQKLMQGFRKSECSGLQKNVRFGVLKIHRFCDSGDSRIFRYFADSEVHKARRSNVLEKPEDSDSWETQGF